MRFANWQARAIGNLTDQVGALCGDEEPEYFYHLPGKRSDKIDVVEARQVVATISLLKDKRHQSGSPQPQEAG